MRQENPLRADFKVNKALKTVEIAFRLDIKEQVRDDVPQDKEN